MISLLRTREFARTIHEDHFDKLGDPYHAHLDRVLGHLVRLFPGVSEAIKHAAVLHGSVEEGKTTCSELQRMGYSEDVIDMVRWNTRPRDEHAPAYLEWIHDLAENAPLGAVMVRIADNEDNNDPMRIARLPQDQQDVSLFYRKARKILDESLCRRTSYLKASSLTRSRLMDSAALVTGASSGIGRAVALALAGQGCRLILSGRSGERLAETETACHSPFVEPFVGDLTDASVRDMLRQVVEKRFPSGLQIFVHCAADLLHGEIERVRVDELRRVVEANVVAPFALLQSLTPLFGRGSTVVLLNSSHGLAAPARTGPYAATKYALRALADAYRDEVNARGIRVLSIYCGKTATGMQQRIYRDRGEAIRYGEIEDHILQPDDVAAIIVSAVALPQTAEVTDIQIRPLVKT